MTSVSQQNQPPTTASNTTSAAQPSQSYASATKKAVSSPINATTTSNSSAAVAVSNAAPVQQNAKSSSISPVNGRPAVMPAVPSVNTPAVAHGSYATNGNTADHSRKGSVTISANGGHMPNGGPVGGQKAGIQFGSITDSPAVVHSTPQIAQSASTPISIPGGNPRVISPAHSPSPIPQPAASGGGRPPSTIQSNGISFGSLGGDGDRHMRQQSVNQQGSFANQNQPPQARRESSGDMSHQGSGAPARGGYTQQNGRGRGNGYNGGFQHQQMAYNPSAQQFRGPPPQGRGNGMPPFQGQGRPMPYPNSPHQTARSPALTNSIPGTPNMGQAMPMPPAQQYGYPQHYMGGPQQVNSPSTSNQQSSHFTSGKSQGKKNSKWKKSGNRQNSMSSNGPIYVHQSVPVKEVFGHSLQGGGRGVTGHPQRGFSGDQTSNFLPMTGHSQISLVPYGVPKLDLSPSTGNFEQILTSIQYGQYPQFDRMGGMMQPNYMQYNPQMPPYMQSMQGPPHSPQPAYQQTYNVGQYNQPQQPQPMSRTSSQISERPSSSMDQQQSVPTIPQAQTPQPKAASFARREPRKSAAILIKRPDGEVVDLPTIKPPVSPAVSNRVNTPPVASTPTPPPKSTTPAHTRAESVAVKSDEQKRLEFKEQMKKAAEVDAATDKKAKDDEAEAKLKDEAKLAEDAKAAEKAAEEAKAAEKADAEAAAKKKQEEEDEEMERQIREMEEAEEAREKAEAEMNAKRAAEKAAAAKANAEKEKAAAEENDRKLREQEREMERLEDERERKRLEAEGKPVEPEVKAEAAVEAKKDAESLAAEVKADNKEASSPVDAGKKDPATPNTLASKLSNMTLNNDSGTSTPTSDDSMGPPPKMSARGKPAALNLAPLNTKPIEAPQPSAALMSLKSARFLTVLNSSLYPPSINSPNPALNSAVASKGKSFKYDTAFLLQFQKVFTEKPSMEFESQIKALIGDSEPGSARAGSQRNATGGIGPRQNSRNNAPGSFAMGSFAAGAMGGKTLPPGTTSEQRYQMSQGSMPRPAGAVNPMASFGRAGNPFPGGSNPMGRIPSSSGMGSNGPNSPRNASNRNQRNPSKRDNYKDSKQEAQAAKTMPLTAGLDLKPIAVTSNGWKPRSLVTQSSATGAAGPAPGASGASGHMDPEMVQRKVKAALNKMTPEKFDKIADQVLAIAAQSKDEADGRTLRQVIQLTFEKATDEAHWASMYAKFCKRMLETMSPEIKDESILDKNGNIVSGGNLFRKYLLNRCQEEFERGWKTDIGDKPEGEEDEAKTEEAAMLSDAYYIAAAAKRRGLGLVQFIGELYKLGMLTERIMHECVKKLVDYTGIPDEAEIESLTKLLKTIGSNLDSTEKGRPMMDVYFQRIKAMEDTDGLPSRLKFMLMDVGELRKKHWHSKEDNKGPKTLDEVRLEAEAAAAQKAAENARGSQRGGGGGGGGRMQMGRGDSRYGGNNSYGAAPPVDYQRNTVASDDLKKLGKIGMQRQQGGTFGPTSMFNSRSSSGRKMAPGSAFNQAAGGDSGASSRTNTPPQQKEKEATTSANAFSLLGDLNDSGETENPNSPPAAASPALAKASPSAKESDS